MTKAMIFPRLKTLMGAYLNQDFDFSYESDDDALLDYARTQRPAVVREAVDEVGRLLDGPTIGLLERFKSDVSRWDFIIGENDEEARRWLLKARGLLADGFGST